MQWYRLTVQEETKQSAFIWAAGTAIGLALGMVITLLIRDRRRQPTELLGGNGGIHIWNIPSGLPAAPVMGMPFPVTQVANAQTAAAARPSKLETYTLSADPSNPSRVATASGDRHWRVQLRNIGPPGSFAVISTDQVGLTFPATTGVMIPAGGFNEIRLKPREVLFAIGNVGGVTLSAASSEELA